MDTSHCYSFPDSRPSQQNSTHTTKTTHSLHSTPNLFNPDLTLLKSSRNAVPIAYSHWGGTDRDELKNPGQRRAGFFDSSKKLHRQSLPLPHSFPPRCPPELLLDTPANDLPREACRQEITNTQLTEFGWITKREERLKPRRRLPGSADGGAPTKIHPAARMSRVAAVRAKDLPDRRRTLPPSCPLFQTDLFQTE